MPSLPELQQGFAHALRGERGTSLPVRARGLSAQQRLQVYRHNHESALLEALRAIYPVTERLVGEAFFATAALSYIGQNPSHSGNIQDYGGALPVFLQGYAPARELAYLHDVAALEWRRLQTAIAPPHQPMDLKALAEVPQEMLPELRFQHQTAARAYDSRFPILSIWEFCQEADPEGELDLDQGGECVLFSRPGHDVQMRLLSPGEYAFLKVLSRGDTFGAACAAALGQEPAFDIQDRFTMLVQEEILTGFHL